VSETRNKQVPWESSSLIGDFYFLPSERDDDNNNIQINAGKREESDLPGRYPEASMKYLKYIDVKGKSAWELKIMRNEIFARHGYIFKTSNMKKHFSQQAWYKPIYEDSSYVYKMFSDIEKSNVNFIKKYE